MDISVRGKSSPFLPSSCHFSFSLVFSPEAETELEALVSSSALIPRTTGLQLKCRQNELLP